MSTNENAGTASTYDGPTVAILVPLTQDMFDNASAEDGLDLIQAANMPSTDGSERLAFFQHLVDGYIEFINKDTGRDDKPLPHPIEAVVNEEGLIHNLPLNVVASRLFDRPLFGTVVVYGTDENGKPRTLSLGLLRALTASYSSYMDMLMSAPIEVAEPVNRYNEFVLHHLLGLAENYEA